MKSQHVMTGIVRASLVTGLLLGLAACSVLDRGRADRAEKEKLEKEGRITMVLTEQRLVVDTSLLEEAIILPEPRSISEGWSQTGSRASKVAGHVAAAQDFAIAWRQGVGKGSSKKATLTAPPVTSADTVYTIDADHQIVASDLTSGQRIWSQTITSGSRRDGLSFGAGIAYHEGRLILASGYGFVALLDAANGAEIWRTQTEAPMTGAPTVKDGRIYVSSNNNEILALNLDTGQVLWSDQAIAESARVLGASSPAVVEDIIVAPYSSGEIIAYLSANGRRLWSEALASSGQFTPISSINDIGARPILGGGLVFAGSQSGVLAAIDGRTGNRVWQQPIGTTQAPALAGEYLFVMGVEAQIACIKAGTGQVVWVRDLDKFRKVEKKKGRITYAGPILASGRVLIVSSLGELIALDPQNGDEVQRLKLGDAVYIEPIVSQDKLLVLTDEARLIAVR